MFHPQTHQKHPRTLRKSRVPRGNETATARTSAPTMAPRSVSPMPALATHRTGPRCCNYMTLQSTGSRHPSSPFNPPSPRRLPVRPCAKHLQIRFTHCSTFSLRFFRFRESCRVHLALHPFPRLPIQQPRLEISKHDLHTPVFPFPNIRSATWVARVAIFPKSFHPPPRHNAFIGISQFLGGRKCATYNVLGALSKPTDLGWLRHRSAIV